MPVTGYCAHQPSLRQGGLLSVSPIWWDYKHELHHSWLEILFNWHSRLGLGTHWKVWVLQSNLRPAPLLWMLSLLTPGVLLRSPGVLSSCAMLILACGQNILCASFIEDYEMHACKWFYKILLKYNFIWSMQLSRFKSVYWTLCSPPQSMLGIFVTSKRILVPINHRSPSIWPSSPWQPFFFLSAYLYCVRVIEMESCSLW